MAKKAVEKKENTSIFDDIIESEFTDVVDLSKTDDSAVDYWVDTGNWALNYTISKRFRGGYPGGRISNLWGQSGVGKSMLPATSSGAKSWEDRNLDQFDRIIVIDSEGGGTGRSLFDFVGAPINKVRYVTISTLDSYKINKETGKAEAVADKEVPAKLDTPTYIYKRGLICFLKKLIYAMEYNNSKEKLCIIIDSLSNIKSFRTAIENGEDMGKTNKLLNNFFALDNDFYNIGATVFITSKVYTNLNNPYDPWVMSGGQAVMFNPSVNLKLSAVESDEISDTEMKAEKERRKTSLGNSFKTVRATVTKSRFGTENRNAWVVFDATYGITRNSGLFKMLYDYGILKRSGNFYSLPGIIVNDKGEDISFYKKDFLTLFGKHEEEYIDKLQTVLEKWELANRESRLRVNVNDMEELAKQQLEEEEAADEEQEGTDMSALLNTMEAELEISASYQKDN